MFIMLKGVLYSLTQKIQIKDFSTTIAPTHMKLAQLTNQLISVSEKQEILTEILIMLIYAQIVAAQLIKKKCNNLKVDLSKSLKFE